MPTLAFAEILAQQVPVSPIYVNPFKLIAIVVLFTGWIAYAQWADKDAVRVNTYRVLWNCVTMACGTLGLVLLLFLPVFFAGVAAYAVVMLALSITYVIHRNGLVVEDDKVCTRAHLSKVMSQGFGGKKKPEDKIKVSERVRIVDASHERVGIPESPEEREVYGFAQDILFDALWRRANLVEFIPAGDVTKVRLTIDGAPATREPLERTAGERIIGFMKGIGGLKLDERRKPQKGQIEATIGDHQYHVVIRTNGSTAGEKLTLQVIGDEGRYKVEDLGFTESQLERVRSFLESDRGLVLLTAPPGGGVTTTVYSFTRSNDAFLQNIQTLEYDKELEVDNITRHVYTPSEEKPFSDELRRVVRTDPDVIVLPELRDKLAAVVASEAAANKQTVYVGLKAADLIDAIRRWMALVPDTKLLAKSVLAVTHQRLVRVLCPSCKAPYKPDPATLKKINAPKDCVLYRVPEQQVDKHGNPILCQNCHGTGYVGRTAVFTILEFDDEMRQVLLKGGSLADIKAAAAKKGGLGIQQHALQKVFDGVTSIEEVVRATRPPAAKPAGKPASPAAAKPAANG